MSSKPYDQAFKYLAEQEADALLQLVGAIGRDEQVTIEPLPRELSVSALAGDQAYLVTTARGRFIIHIEAQTVYDSAMPQRMPEYAVLWWLKYRLPVFSYVLLLTPRKLPADAPTTGIIQFGDTRIVTSYHLVQLWEIPATEMLALERAALLPFVPLMAGSEQVLEASAARLRQVADEQQRRELALHFVMLGGLRYNRAELLEMVWRRSMIPIEQLRESSFYQFILDEGREEGRKEGRAEGREEGREEGLVALAEVFRMLAAKRFPGLQLGSEVEAVGDLDALHQLCYELEQIPDPAALQQRLLELAAARHPQS